MKTQQENTTGKAKPVLSAASRFNLRFMKRTNMLAISMFIVGILAKLIHWLLTH
jgi:hypothetical protein